MVNRYQTEVLYLLFLIIEGIFQTLDGHGGAHGMVHEIYGLANESRVISLFIDAPTGAIIYCLQDQRVL